MYIEDKPYLKSPKAVSLPDFMICRRWMNQEADFLDYRDKEYPFLAVFIKPQEEKDRKLNLLDGKGKLSKGYIFKGLREICSLYQLPELFGVVTNFTEWHFFQYDAQEEIEMCS